MFKKSAEYFKNLDTSSPMMMNHLGRLYAKYDDLGAIECAAMNFATSSEEDQKSQIWWWNEGVRDYAKDTQHTDEMNEALMAEVRRISQ